MGKEAWGTLTPWELLPKTALRVKAAVPRGANCAQTTKSCGTADAKNLGQRKERTLTHERTKAQMTPRREETREHN